jgi:hypothetical protein
MMKTEDWIDRYVAERLAAHEVRVRDRELAEKAVGGRWQLTLRKRNHEAAERARKRELKSKPCGAKTRAGHPCMRRGHGKGGRCANHGGLSTGPKTAEGRLRIAETQRKRWAAEKI